MKGALEAPARHAVLPPAGPYPCSFSSCSALLAGMMEHSAVAHVSGRSLDLCMEKSRGGNERPTRQASRSAWRFGVGLKDRDRSLSTLGRWLTGVSRCRRVIGFHDASFHARMAEGDARGEQQTNEKGSHRRVSPGQDLRPP